MSARNGSDPYLRQFYHRYLRDQQTADFTWEVARRYQIGTLERIAVGAPVQDRRAAVLALGLLGDFGSNDVLARALTDTDRCVRILAADAIQQVWLMAGSDAQRRRLLVARRFLSAGCVGTALEIAESLCVAAPDYAEAWNERAVAQFCLGDSPQALDDCFTTVELNPHHFRATVGIGHCYIDLQNPSAALTWYRRALDVHPELEQVRHEVKRLERLLKRA